MTEGMSNKFRCHILFISRSGHTSTKSGDSGRTRSATTSQIKPPRPRRQETEELPPGYLQSLMNKIVNNVNIVVNNLIIKFVEDDIVLSVNVKSAECYSVDNYWNRAFTELSSPELVLRKAVNFCDLTVCLDKRDASGRIDNYQDPMIYRCSVACRVHMKYESIHGKVGLILNII
jgi:vacuolar protein sorting-associated protein 13B